MKLQILRVRDKGTPESEVIQFEVLEDTNLHDYLVADSTFGEDGNITNTHRHFYAFASQSVKKGDFVNLYTKVGTNDFFTNNAGSRTYRIYWNLKVSVWNNTGDVAVLYYAPQWSTLKVN